MSEISETLTVECAAILDDDKRIWSVPRPGRHHNVIALMGSAFRQHFEQGFVLSDGRFVMRKAALRVATEAGQIIKGPTAPQHGLFSEDVW